MNLILTILRPSRLFTLTSVVLLLTVFTTSLWAFVTPAHAATGINGQINFQGKLVDNNGLNVADGTYTVVFTLYDAASSGTNLWTETDSVTTSAGIFQVALGAGTSLSTVNFNLDSIYLGIKVGADAEMTPRIRFTAVPYAFNAQKVNGLTVTNTSGNAFSSTTTLQIGDGKTVAINNGLTFSGTDGTNITFQGTDTYVGRGTIDTLTNKTIGATGLTFSGATADLLTGSNQNLTITANGSGDVILTSDADTSVSIGSAGNTLAPLSIAGGIGSNASLIVNQLNSGDLFAASASGLTKFRVANNGDVVLSAGLNAGGTVGNSAQCLTGGATASWGACGSSGSNYWQLNGPVLSPGNLTTDLLLGGTATASAKFGFLNVAGGTPTASISAQNVGGQGLSLGGDGSIQTTRNNTLTIGGTTTGNIQFKPGNATNSLYLASNGSVGIGTTTPTQASLYIINNGRTSTDASVIVQQAPGQTGDLLQFYNSSASLIAKMDSSGNLAVPNFVDLAGTGPYLAFSGAASILNTRSGSNTGLVLRAGGAVQTGNLLELQNSGGTSISSFNGTGQLGIGTGTLSAQGTLDIRSLSGTLPVASISGVTSKASLLIDNSGVGDLFTASKSGASKFTIKNNGDVQIANLTTAGGVLYSNGSGTIAQTALGTGAQCLLGGATPTWGSCGSGGGGTNYFQLNGGVISPFSNTADLLIGGTSTASADFAFINVNSGTPTASISANNGSNAIYLSGDGVLGTTNKQTLQLGSASTGNVSLISGGTTALTAITNGNVGIGTTAPIAALQIGANASSATPGFIFAGNASSNVNGNASYVGNWQSSNLWGIGPGTNVNGDNTLRLGQTSSNTSNVWNPTQSTRFILNGPLGTSALAALDVRAANATLPIASFSGATSFAAAIVDQSGSGDIFTASKSGATKFTITNSGTVLAAGLDGLPGAGGGGGSPATITHVQSTGTTNVSSASSISQAFGSSNTAGNLIVVAITFDSFSAATVTCSDSQSNTYGTQIIRNDTTNNQELVVCYAANIKAGANNVTATFNASTPSRGIAIHEYSGVALSSPLDVSASNNAVATTSLDAVTSTTATTTQNGDLIFGTVFDNDSTNTILAGTGFTQRVPQASAFQTQDKVQATAGSVANTNTFSATHRYNSIMAAFKAQTTSGSGGTSVLNIGTANATTINLGANNGLVLDTVNNLVGIGTASPLARVDVRGSSGTLPTASISAKSSFAGLVVNNSGVGDLLTASSGGQTRFNITNNGSTLFQGDSITSIGSGASGNGSGAVTNAIGDEGSMVPNAGFESNILGGFADGWYAAATNSATITRDTTNTTKGSASLKVVLTNSSTAIYSTCMPLSGLVGSYTLNYYAKATAPIPTVRAYVDGYTTKAKCQSDTTNLPTAPADVLAKSAAAWVRYGTSTTAVGVTNTSTWGRVHFYIACTTNCTNSTINLDGVRLTESTTGQGLDYAEQYPVDPSNIPQPGDVVSVQANASDQVATVAPANKYMDQSVIGVVSTNAGETLDDGTMGNNKVPVALAGRIPTHVSTKNGAIHIGDYLTSSTIPGVAVKATTAGQVIGQAMQEYTDSDATKIGSVVMFVKNTYFNGLPLTLNSGLTQDNAQGDLAFLGTLVDAAQKTASTSSALTTISADKVTAGLEVITPKVIADTVQVNTLKASTGSDVSVSLDDNGSFVIKNASGEARVAFDNKGNAFFAGTITADKIKANQIEGLDVSIASTTSLASRVSTLETLFASQSAISVLQSATASPAASPIADQVFLASLQSDQDATVSGSLRVKGNGLIEGVLHVVDTLTANNLIVNQIADFFSTVNFHGDVFFAGHPTFNADTAGYVTIPKGSDNTAVTFTTEYKTQPVINASIVTQEMTDDLYKNLKTAGVCSTDQTKSSCEDTYTKSIISEGAQFVIAKRTTKGFIIVLGNKATQDMTFSWTALSIGNETSMKGSTNQ